MAEKDDKAREEYLLGELRRVLTELADVRERLSLYRIARAVGWLR